MKPLLLGVLVGLLWILAPSLIALAATVALTVLAKAAPAALLLALAARTVPGIRRWTT